MKEGFKNFLERSLNYLSQEKTQKFGRKAWGERLRGPQREGRTVLEASYCERSEGHETCSTEKLLKDRNNLLTPWSEPALRREGGGKKRGADTRPLEGVSDRCVNLHLGSWAGFSFVQWRQSSLDIHGNCTTKTGPFKYIQSLISASLVAQLVKNLPARQETQVQFLGQKDLLEKGQGTHSSILGLPWWLSW